MIPDIIKDMKQHFIGVATPAAAIFATAGIAEALDAGPVGITCLALAAGMGAREGIDRLSGKYNFATFGSGVVFGLLLAQHGFGWLDNDLENASLEQARTIEMAAADDVQISVAMIGDEPFFVPG